MQESDTGATGSLKPRAWAEPAAVPRCCRRVRRRKRTRVQRLRCGGTSAGQRDGRRCAGCNAMRPHPSVCPHRTCPRWAFSHLFRRNISLKLISGVTTCKWEMESGIREGEEGGFSTSCDMRRGLTLEHREMSAPGADSPPATLPRKNSLVS